MAGQETAACELSEEQLRKAPEFIEKEQGRFSRHKGWLAALRTAVTVAIST